MKRWKHRPEGSTWGDWGDDDQLGRLNLITPERRRHAASLVRKGAVFSLAIAFDLDGVPQLPVSRRINPHHWMLQTGTDLRAGCQAGAVDGWGYADEIVAMGTQAWLTGTDRALFEPLADHAQHFAVREARIAAI